MTKRFTALVVTIAMSSTLLLAAGGTASAAPPTIDVQVPVTGTFPGGGTFTGTFDIDRIVRSGGQLSAVGSLTGTLTNGLGDVVGTVTDFPVTLPLQVSGSCEILDLVLGPLDLDLLGLVVHLDTVHLNITAEQGPGNLLGNLLCAVAGLLDGPATPLNALVRLLNRILGLLG